MAGILKIAKMTRIQIKVDICYKEWNLLFSKLFYKETVK